MLYCFKKYFKCVYLIIRFILWSALVWVLENIPINWNYKKCILIFLYKDTSVGIWPSLGCRMPRKLKFKEICLFFWFIIINECDKHKNSQTLWPRFFGLSTLIPKGSLIYVYLENTLDNMGFLSKRSFDLKRDFPLLVLHAK